MSSWFRRIWSPSVGGTRPLFVSSILLGIVMSSLYGAYHLSFHGHDKDFVLRCLAVFWASALTLPMARFTVLRFERSTETMDRLGVVMEKLSDVVDRLEKEADRGGLRRDLEEVKRSLRRIADAYEKPLPVIDPAEVESNGRSKS